MTALLGAGLVITSVAPQRGPSDQRGRGLRQPGRPGRVRPSGACICPGSNLSLRLRGGPCRALMAELAAKISRVTAAQGPLGRHLHVEGQRPSSSRSWW